MIAALSFFSASGVAATPAPLFLTSGTKAFPEIIASTFLALPIAASAASIIADSFPAVILPSSTVALP